MFEQMKRLQLRERLAQAQLSKALKGLAKALPLEGLDDHSVNVARAKVRAAQVRAHNASRRLDSALLAR